jgi:hypothetical protein
MSTMAKFTYELLIPTALVYRDVVLQIAVLKESTTRKTSE